MLRSLIAAITLDAFSTYLSTHLKEIRASVTEPVTKSVTESATESANKSATESATFDPQIRRSSTRQKADYQANGLIGECRSRGLNPIEVARSLAKQISHTQLSSLQQFNQLSSLNQRTTGDAIFSKVEASGPGFLNFTISNSFLAEQIENAEQIKNGEPLKKETPQHNQTQRSNQTSEHTQTPQHDQTQRSNSRVVIDYSSPNVAKEMHVGHLRSTIIGDALARMFEFSGVEVIRQNHVGDWGTPFGMLIEHLIDSGISAKQLSTNAKDVKPNELSNFYRDARAKFESSCTFHERSKRRVVLLQSGDCESMRLWQTLRDASYSHFASVYQDLDVLLTDADIKAESSYQPQLAEMVEELQSKNLLKEDNGALCAFPAGFASRDGAPLPFIVRKADGGFGYAATDLAAIRYRATKLQAKHIVYVVGAPQSLHFSMLFAVAKQAGWLDGVEVSHAAFGSVLGVDGKMMKSREGEVAPLNELIKAAVRQVRNTAEGRAHVQSSDIHKIALSALKYADLSNDRVNDYTFDVERMTKNDGNTGPYLLYAHMRIAAIFRHANRYQHEDTNTKNAKSENKQDKQREYELQDRHKPRNKHKLQIIEPQERQLAFALLEFQHAFDTALQQLNPHLLCSYAYALARAFTHFYETCPILNEADIAVTRSRLQLCSATAAHIHLALSLLGIATVEYM